MKKLKKWKESLHNCPYLVTLLVIWLFLTTGGIGMIIYRDYGRGLDWTSFWSNPLFAIVMEEELHGSTGSPVEEEVMAKITEQEQIAGKQNNESISRVMPYLAEPGNDKEEINYDIMNWRARYQDGSKETQPLELTMLEFMEQYQAQVGNPGETESQESTAEAEKEEETVVVGVTNFIPYTPVETDSIYFEDVGKLALTTEYPYTTVEEDYFADAAFLGDSRTLGLADYSGIDADFYCESGMTIYKLFGEKGVTYQKTGAKVNLSEALQQNIYGKIYIMLGMNELGYRTTEYFQEKYQSVVEQIREWQPQAIIFVMANLHVSAEKNNLETEFNNININAKNVAAATLANGIDIFYLDSNPLFTDEDGLLLSDLTFDGVHLYANNYLVWKNFLMEHGVVKENDGKENSQAE